LETKGKILLEWLGYSAAQKLAKSYNCQQAIINAANLSKRLPAGNYQCRQLIQETASRQLSMPPTYPRDCQQAVTNAANLSKRLKLFRCQRYVPSYVGFKIEKSSRDIQWLNKKFFQDHMPTSTSTSINQNDLQSNSGMNEFDY
jgi:hypothetical protein